MILLKVMNLLLKVKQEDFKKEEMFPLFLLRSFVGNDSVLNIKWIQYFVNALSVLYVLQINIFLVQ